MISPYVMSPGSGRVHRVMRAHVHWNETACDKETGRGWESIEVLRGNERLCGICFRDELARREEGYAFVAKSMRPDGVPEPDTYP